MRYVILIEFGPKNLQLCSDEEDGRATILPSEATAREVARAAVWSKLPWWIIPVDDMDEG